MEKALKTIEHLILYVVIFLVPLIVIPVFPNVFATPKLAILTFGVLLILVLKIIRSLIRGTVSIHVGSFDIPLLALAATYIASLIIRSPNKMEGLLLPGSTTLIVSLVLLYFFVSQLTEKHKQLIKIILIATGVFASVMSLLALAGIFKAIPAFPAYMKEPTFSPLEGNVQALLFFLGLMPLVVQLFVTTKDMSLKALMGTSAAIIVFGIIISALNLLPGRPTAAAMPGLRTSWEVAVDAVKEYPLLGAGSGNYVTAFNRFRPVAYNATDLWTVRFSNARSFYLTVMTEAGLLGVIVLVLLFLNFFKIFRKIGNDKSLLATTQQGSLVLLLILFALFPAGIVSLLLFFVILGLVATTRKFEYEPKGAEWVHKMPVFLLSVPTLLAALVIVYFAGRIAIAEARYRDGLEAIVRNDGKAAYDTLRSAIVVNPYVDRYRASYAQVNLALANNVAQKKDLTDQDRTTISSLIQQAIREGKATVVLNQTRAGNWELLSSIYRSIIPLAKGADQFAVQTIRQAVALDPINPNLRVTLGGLHYSLKDYDGAVNNFTMAAQLKPDFANAYYNLALAYREKKDINKAIAAMKVVVQLLEKNKDKNQKDYDVAKTELENLEKQKPAAPPAQGDNLSPAGQQQKDQLNPKVDLPADANPPAAPPEAEQAPTPSPSPVPSAAPSSTPGI